MTTPKDNTKIEVNNLSDESKSLLGELERMSTKAAELIGKLYTSLKRDGLTPMEARKMIEQRIDVSQVTLRRALPQEAKQHQTHHKRKGNQNDYLSKSDKMTTSNATLVLDKEPDIPAPHQPIIEHTPELEPEPKPELVHRTIRITMSPESMVALGNAMVAKVKAEGFKTNYAIEYDYVDKALYVDIAEKWEKVLMVQ